MAVLRISNALASVLAAATATAVSAGTPDSTLVIYNGAQPASVDTAVSTQTALVTFVLPDPAFGAPALVTGGAQITGEPIASVDADASGTATWFRIFDGDGNAVIDGDVTDTAGTGSLKVSSTSVVAGIAVEIVSMTYRQRTGA